MQIDPHIDDLRLALKSRIRDLETTRTRLNGAGLLSADAATAAVTIRAIGAALGTLAVDLMQAQRLAAAYDRAELCLPKV